MIVLQILVGVVGAFIVFGTVLSAIRTFVLPRAAPVLIGRIVFLGLRSVFNLFARPPAPTPTGIASWPSMARWPC